MKKRKLGCILLLSLWMIQPIQAKEANVDTILIMSEQLPYLIYVKITNDDTIALHFIPSNLMVPLSCASALAAPVSSLLMNDQVACIKTSVENFFDIQIQNTIYLHMDTISKDTGISMNNYDFQTIADLSAFFEKVANKVDLAMILRYSSYIDSDLPISSYYKYYKMRKQNLTLHYNYMPYIVLDTLSIPLDNTFYKQR